MLWNYLSTPNFNVRFWSLALYWAFGHCWYLSQSMLVKTTPGVKHSCALLEATGQPPQCYHIFVFVSPWLSLNPSVCFVVWEWPSGLSQPPPNHLDVRNVKLAGHSNVQCPISNIRLTSCSFRCNTHHTSSLKCLAENSTQLSQRFKPIIILCHMHKIHKQLVPFSSLKL